jgi:hypothetical protein
LRLTSRWRRLQGGCQPGRKKLLIKSLRHRRLRATPQSRVPGD